VVYELGAWPLELQAAAAEAMAESSIPHGWDGLDLVVHLDHEAAVDAIMASVEEEHGEAAAADDAELTYELDEWPEHDRHAVTAKLAEGGVPYRWEDESTLVVASRDEQLVEEILDEVEFPDALPRFDDLAGLEGAEGEPAIEGDGGEPADDDTEPVDADPEMMGNLFVAADRLIRNPLDPAGVESLNHILGEIDPDVPPYGVAPALWHKVVDGAEAMGDALAEEGETRLPEVSHHATMVRDLLRPYV
jgi:hypothetical protein